jgi:hypothetical protein
MSKEPEWIVGSHSEFQKAIDLMKQDIIKHCDGKIEAWFKKQEALQKKEQTRQAKNRAAIERHNKVVEKFLALMVKALARRG